MLTLKGNRVLIILVAVLICSCDQGKTLLIKNVTDRYDSIPIEIKVNNKTEIKGYEKRSNVSLDYTEKIIDIDSDSISIEVILPTLNINKLSRSTSDQANIIVVTINEVFSQDLFDSIIKVNPSNHDMTLYKMPQISIAFLKKRLDQVH